ncbi:MAG: RNA polymerase sigma factor [Oscillospiraceae bacterium]|nr:RNA polymerase sigma factor [Oscillospiraceae bacterium]MBQ3049287.1 RNA polymerase sigma factor [Oscillospiraceae bacterium]MBQ9939615.1 RNA polymerase sigma factor [Oscillospiraceae bacterium]
MDNGASSYRRFRDNGDENGLAEIIRLYRDGLIFYLNSIVGNIHLAEELAEDTFVLLGTKKPKNKGGASFKTWLYTIGRNLAINHLRKHSKMKKISVDELAELMDDESDLEKLYLRDERSITVHRALGTLKAEYRQVLWLVYFEGLSHKETSAVMKRSVHNIDTLVYRARKALKTQLERSGFFYEEL